MGGWREIRTAGRSLGRRVADEICFLRYVQVKRFAMFWRQNDPLFTSTTTPEMCFRELSWILPRPSKRYCVTQRATSSHLEVYPALHALVDRCTSAVGLCEASCLTRNTDVFSHASDLAARKKRKWQADDDQHSSGVCTLRSTRECVVEVERRRMSPNELATLRTHAGIAPNSKNPSGGKPPTGPAENIRWKA